MKLSKTFPWYSVKTINPASRDILLCGLNSPLPLLSTHISTIVNDFDFFCEYLRILKARGKISLCLIQEAKYRNIIFGLNEKEKGMEILKDCVSFCLLPIYIR